MNPTDRSNSYVTDQNTPNMDSTIDKMFAVEEIAHEILVFVDPSTVMTLRQVNHGAADVVARHCDAFRGIVQNPANAKLFPRGFPIYSRLYALVGRTTEASIKCEPPPAAGDPSMQLGNVRRRWKSDASSRTKFLHEICGGSPDHADAF